MIVLWAMVDEKHFSARPFQDVAVPCHLILVLELDNVGLSVWILHMRPPREVPVFLKNDAGKLPYSLGAPHIPRACFGTLVIPRECRHPTR